MSDAHFTVDLTRGAERVVIERGGLGFKISDEDGEFAQSTTIDAALVYAANLLHGPGTGVHVKLARYPAQHHHEWVGDNCIHCGLPTVDSLS